MHKNAHVGALGSAAVAPGARLEMLKCAIAQTLRR
jgi:hypothetical protein